MSGPRIPAAARWLTVSLVLALLFPLVAQLAQASTGLTPGDDAVIVNTNGDLSRLRTKPGVNGAVVAEYPEGTAVRVVDEPRFADDGATWYRVAVEGEAGYIAAEYLAPVGSVVTEPNGAEPEGELDAANTELAPSVIGTATIVNTNGQSVRCRSSASAESRVISLFLGGDTVELTGDPVDGWQPVLCGGTTGFVHSDFIGTVDDPANETVNEQSVETASESDDIVVMAEVVGAGTISGTNGEGVRCRSRATTDGTIIMVLAEGSSVDLRGTERNGWYPVVCNSKNGYVWAEFISVAGGGDSESASTGNGTIVNTDGSGLRCRNKASYEGAVITVLIEGDQVELRGSQEGEWQPVYCAGKKGYVHAGYIDTSGSSSGGGSSGGGSSSGLGNDDRAEVSGTNGDGVRFRSAASSSASVITVLSEGAIVDVVSGSIGDWVAVKYRGSNGFVHRDYLVESSGSSSGGDGTAGGLAIGDHAQITDTLNFRANASSSGSVQGVAAPGTVVLITGGKQNGYFPVEWGGMAGFMHGDFLTWTGDALTPGSSGVGGNAGGGSPSSTGQAMVDYAMNYLGYPYIWATAGPNSFDCSGFTYWVTKHVIGDDIGRGLWTQVVAGTPVSYGNLKPGDLVFFQNTYTWGLSHVGIYIGNNQFIHAENEETGVRISSITSTYYSTRYYGAVRLG